MSTIDTLNVVISADTGNATQNIQNTANELNKLGEAANNSDTDVTALVRAMSTAAEQMVSISQNIAISAGGLADFQANLTGVSSSLTGLNLRFDTLNSSIQSAYGAFDGAASSVGQLAQASDNSAAAITNITAATDGFGARMSELQASTGGTVESMDALKAEFSTALASIKNFSTNIDAAGTDAAETAQKIKELSEQINKIPNGSGNVGDLSKQFRALKGVIATLGIGAFIKDSQNAYTVQMQNELKLASHMQHRMNATNDEIESIKQLASEQQKLGVIGDEIQLAGAQQLTTYARQSSTLKTLIPAMNNLIAQNAGYEASTGDAISAADMLGRALGGQYTMLRRMGITFTEAQENVLKYGTETQKAAVLADAINAKVGNMNQLLAQTPTGQLKQLQNELGDFQEELAATWQPLISAYLPIIRGMLDAIKEPIKNVAAGVTIIGQAIAKVDSPAVRAIALTAAGIAVLSKLQLLIGGTSAGLLALGVVLAGIIGKMSGAQTSVSDIVEQAMNSAEAATNNASDAMGDYTESVEDAQKAVSRLAGFDTITKLTGATQGSLVAQMFGENGIEDAKEASETVQSAINDIQNTLSSLSIPTVDLSNINWDEIQNSLIDYIGSINWTETFKKIGNGVRDGIKFGLNVAKTMLRAIGEWCAMQDWQAHFRVIGEGYEEVMSASLNVVDSLFHTHLEDWWAWWLKKAHAIGKGVEETFNANQHAARSAEQQYEEEHGTTAWLDFLQKYQAGTDPTQAFKEVFTTAELQAHFFEDLWRNAAHNISEWEGLSKSDLEQLLNKDYYAANVWNEAGKALLNGTFTSGIGIVGGVRDAAVSLVNSSQSANTSGGVYDYIALMEALDRYNEKKQGLEKYGAPTSITVYMTMDGEVVGQVTQNITNAQTITSNGLYGVN